MQRNTVESDEKSEKECAFGCKLKPNSPSDREDKTPTKLAYRKNTARVIFLLILCVADHTHHCPQPYTCSRKAFFLVFVGNSSSSFVIGSIAFYVQKWIRFNTTSLRSTSTSVRLVSRCPYFSLCWMKGCAVAIGLRIFV